MSKIAVIYWPKKGSVEKVSNVLSKKLQNHELLLVDVSEVDVESLMNYDIWIFGGSTVGAHSWQDASYVNHWSFFFEKLNQFDLKEKTIAFFGLGDQLHYPHHFVDDLNEFQQEFTKRNANVVGKWPTEGYEFYESEGVEGDFFYGLAIDEDNQAELTEERLDIWIKQIIG